MAEARTMTDTATTPAPAPAKSGTPLVEMRNINVAFGGVHAVRDVTIALALGWVVRMATKGSGRR